MLLLVVCLVAARRNKKKKQHKNMAALDNSLNDKLKAMVLSFGINVEEQKYWDFIIARFTEEQTKTLINTLTENPELFPDLNHNLIKKIMFFKSGRKRSDWQKILEEEKKTLEKIIKD